MIKNKIEYSIVIPVYRSGEWIDELILRIKKIMEEEISDSYELIMVDDCSPDTFTWPAIERNASLYRWIRGYRLLYNVGQFKATMCGLEKASGSYIITMDDDLQHPPEEIPKLIEAMKQNPTMDCIMGKYVGKQHSVYKNAGSWLAKFLKYRLYQMPSDIDATSFRIMPAAFKQILLLFRIASPQLGPLIAGLTNRIMNVQVEHHVRKKGISGYSLSKSVMVTLELITNASIIPLRVFSVFGFIASVLSFGMGIYYILRWFFVGASVPGFTTTTLLISFFCGAILAGIGILGEYISRIIREITGMPRYTVHLSVGENN